MSDQPIRVVLDTSAVIAYAYGSINVGEVIVEITEEQGSFAVPAVCLVQAADAVADAQLRLLTVHRACRVLPLLYEATICEGRAIGRKDKIEAYAH